MKIIQDDREPNLQLLADVNNMNIKFIKKRMFVGDYQYENLLIERKEISDLCSSILDGRINSQVENMKDWQRDFGKYGKGESFIIIVGSLKDKKVDIHKNCILGKMVSLVYKHNIKLLWVEDEFQFLYVLKNLCDKYLKENEKEM